MLPPDINDVDNTALQLPVDEGIQEGK